MTLAARVQSSSRSASPYSARPVHRGSACWAYALVRLLRLQLGGGARGRRSSYAQ